MTGFQPMGGLDLTAVGQCEIAGAVRRAARFQQWPGGEPSVATVTELQRKSLCIVTMATTVDRWEGKEGGREGWREMVRGREREKKEWERLGDGMR